MSLELILESLIFAADQPLTAKKMQALFPEPEQPALADIEQALANLAMFYQGRALELKQVASGYRFQVKADYSPWLGRLFEEKPPRYSKATLETLAIIAYRQPVTRGDIEDIRGVAVNSQIIKTLMERDWIKIVGYKEVPGKPALFATTRNFLDYFNLNSLAQLPTLIEPEQEPLEPVPNPIENPREQTEKDITQENPETSAAENPGND